MRWLEKRVPPPLVMASFAAMAWVAARQTPALVWSHPWRGGVALAFGALGLCLGAAAILSFIRARTTVDPHHPDKASALVTGGVFRLTRNPMYLGMLFILLGWTAALGHPAGALFAALFVLWIDRLQIAPEERALAQRFGDAYAAYRARVRRWI
jgi:protein-S-isoprenylcysteine O-methyltransferase Ste14